MKKILRMIIFSGVAIYLTALWDKGFIIVYNPTIFLETTLLIALAYYLIIPIAKVILLPLNILTFGLLSTLLAALTFYVLDHYTLFVQIKAWTFPGITYLGITVQSMPIGYLFNFFLVSFSVSTIIKGLDRLI